MGSAGSFEEKDRAGAHNFAAAARAAGVRRIIYLGGLGDSSAELSTHLRSRHEVGEVLRESGVQVIEFRASIIIGSGSLSFEMVRALAERLPVMVTPKWVAVKAQPIAIVDMIEYLVAALKLEAGGNPIYEIGGADIVSYGDILREYSRQRGLHRDDDSRARSYAAALELVARAGDSAVCARRPQAYRQHDSSDRSPRRQCAQSIFDKAAGNARSDRARSAQ